MKKVLVLFFLLSSIIFAKAPVYKVLMSETVPKGYETDVYKKTIVLMTEARLYLQKKYKKKIIFEYQEKLLKNKSAILKELDKIGARFYVFLDIDKKATKANLEKVLYNLTIIDKKNKRKKVVKTKAIIRDKKVVKITAGDLKKSAKKIAKILKKR